MGEANLSSVIEPLQGYLLSSKLERNFSTDPESFAKFREHIGSFGDEALRSENDPWDRVDVYGREHNFQELSR